MNNETEKKESYNINRFELDGNVGSFGTPYETSNGKKRMRFDLAQTKKDGTGFIPIVLTTNLVDTYGKEIQKGDWLVIKGTVNSYIKETEKDGKKFNTKELEMIAFEIEDKEKNIVYKVDGQVIKKDKQEEMERQ